MVVIRIRPEGASLKSQVLERLQQQEGHKFKASLSNLAKSYLRVKVFKCSGCGLVALGLFCKRKRVCVSI